VDSEETKACRKPGGGDVAPVPAWKFHALRRAILHAVEGAGPEGLALSALPGAVKARMSQGDLARLGSLGWHCTVVRDEMEVAGEIARRSGPGPQRLVRA
jgi:hypothetical protein